MVYSIIAAIIIVSALALALLTSKLLVKTSWFLGWLRGMGGLLLISTVVFLVFTAFDVFSYKNLAKEQKVATIHFNKINHQHYVASFIDQRGNEKDYELFGDQWQLDSRVIKWKASALKLGIYSGYRLDRLAGRYLSLEDERNKPRRVHAFHQNVAGIDIWHWLNQADDWIDIVDARYGSGVFLPMVDKGHYQISLTATGLIAKPLNEPAKEAVALWQ